MKAENFTDINTALLVKVLQAAQQQFLIVKMNPLFSRYSSEVLVLDSIIMTKRTSWTSGSSESSLYCLGLFSHHRTTN
jgi:hypothetical protein